MLLLVLSAVSAGQAAEMPAAKTQSILVRVPGIEIERYNLSQQTQAFVSNATVTDALKKDGNECLPLILVDGKIVFQGAYPKRDKLAEMAGVEAPKSGLKFTVEQAVAVGSGCCSAPPAAEQESCCDESTDKKSDQKSCC